MKIGVIQLEKRQQYGRMKNRGSGDEKLRIKERKIREMEIREMEGRKLHPKMQNEESP